MAITSAIMQMRRGNEADFDPDKMHPGEWAVSTDEKYVRMCFSPGVCVRMATYEAFEEDMEQIISILEEANTVKEAIEEIYKEFQEAELDIEAAENSATLSKSYAIGGTNTREGEDTDNAKYYAELAKENIEPVMNAVSDISLNRQTLGYVKKNLLKITATTQTINGMTFTVNDNKSVTLNNMTTGTTSKVLMSGLLLDDYFKAGKYIYSIPETITDIYSNFIILSGTTRIKTVYCYGTDVSFDILEEYIGKGYTIEANIVVKANVEVSNLTLYPMIRSADVEDDTYEPYVDDVDTRLKAMTPVTNLITTVAGKPLDAIMGKELNDKILAVDGKIIFSETEPTTVEAGKIVMVYE